jgi:hypothetical protein
VRSVDRISGCVRRQLGDDCGIQVDLQHVSKPYEVKENVRELLTDPGSDFRIGTCARRLGLGHPLKDLDQLANLAGECHGQILR